MAPLPYASIIALTVTYIPATQMKAPTTIVMPQSAVWNHLRRQPYAPSP